MRKKARSFFSLFVCIFVSALCESCKGGRLSLESVEPHIVYDFSEGEQGGQYLVVFVQTEHCEEVKSISILNKESALRWHSISVSKVADNFFFSVFSPAPGSVMPSADYELTMTDFYGASAQLPFSLRYDGAMASLSRTELMTSGNYLSRSAYFDKSGRLAIFEEIDKDSTILKAYKTINGKRFCCVSGDGNTICLFPYEEIH